MKSLLIIGAGGHCRSVISTINKLNEWQIEGIIDIDYKGGEEHILGNRVIGGISSMPSLVSKNIVIAVGDNRHRHKIVEQYLYSGYEFPNIIHPNACIDESSSIGVGNYIAYGAYVGPLAAIGDFNICNTRSTLEHEVTVGNYCHFAPSATLCGRVSIGNQVLVGAGGTIIPYTSIGSYITIGAQSVVINSIEESSGTYIGIPAKKIK